MKIIIILYSATLIGEKIYQKSGNILFYFISLILARMHDNPITSHATKKASHD